MNLKNVMALLVVQVCLVFCLPVSAQMQSKPRWAQKGEKSMNKQRSNESYRFKVFNTWGIDANKLREERFEPLLTYVRECYDADHNQMRLDSVRSGADSITTYRISFACPSGDGVVYARRVDEHCAFEDYADNTYQFEYHQLYAISEKDSVPVFDEFKLTRKYNLGACAMSLIPGMGQIYKGQTAKGFAILGAEATLVASAIAFQMKKSHCGRKADENPGFRDSWESKERGWRQMRNICIGLAGGLYVYNLLDAAIAKGSRHVVVGKSKDSQLLFTPTASLEGAGMTFTYNF